MSPDETRVRARSLYSHYGRNTHLIVVRAAPENKIFINNGYIYTVRYVYFIRGLFSPR